MKTLRFATIASLLFVGSLCKAQANWDMESWGAVIPSVSGNSPQGWVATSVANVNGVIEVSPGANGTAKAAQLTSGALSWALANPLQGFIPDTAAVMLTGKIVLLPGLPPVVRLKPGIPYSSRPTNLKFYSKYQPNGTDTGWVMVFLTRNPNGAGRDTIGSLIYTETTASTAFAMHEPTITYSNPDPNVMPDSMTVIVSASSLSHPKVGSVFTIDEFTNLTLGFGTSENDQLALYPNPAQTMATLELPIGPCQVRLMDALGRELQLHRVSSPRMSLNLGGLGKGLYLVQIVNVAGITRSQTLIIE
jgi:hypothetical protein